jgi:SAM-dependent methyltransferase
MIVTGFGGIEVARTRPLSTTEEADVEQGFKVAGTGPQAYERYLVPAVFAACADQLLEFAPVAPGQRVLDVACGTGIVARKASARVGGAGAVVGVDVNEGMIEAAKAAGEPGTVTWHVADASAMPLPDASFDVAYCQHGLQFFTDRARALSEMHRVLVPGGRVAVAVWRALEHSPAYVALAQVLQRHVGDDAGELMRAPFRWSDRDRIRGHLAGAGFVGITVRIGVVAIRFGSAEDLLHHQVVSSPLAGPVGRLDADRVRSLNCDVARTLDPHADDDGVVFPAQVWLATAHRPQRQPTRTDNRSVE